MPVTERERHRMIQAFEQTWGQEVAMTLAEYLPPVGWADVATKHDVEALRNDVRTSFEGVHKDFEGVHKDIEGVRTGIDALRNDTRRDIENLEHRLRSAIDQKFATNMRAMMFAFVTALISFGGLFLGAGVLGRP